MRIATWCFGLATLVIVGAAHTQVHAQGMGMGPGGLVASACASDIKKFCPDKGHDGGIRACLEAQKADVSAACRTALNSTGGGQMPR